MKKAIAASLVLFGLASCGNYAPIETPPAAVSFAASFDQERVVGTDQMVLRTYFRDAENRRQEVVGARCTLSSREFSVTVASPAAIEMPVIKSVPSNLITSCEGNGLIGQMTIEPSLGDRYVQTGAGLGVAILSAVISEAIVTEADNWSYARSGPVINVDLQ